MAPHGETREIEEEEEVSANWTEKGQSKVHRDLYLADATTHREGIDNAHVKETHCQPHQQ